MGKTAIRLGERVRERLIVHKVLGGLLNWVEIVKQDSLGNEIHITADHQINKVYLNGNKLAPKAPKTKDGTNE